MTDFNHNLINELTVKIQDHSLKLASLPDIIVRINEAIADERKSSADIAKVVQTDISLTTRIMQIANSPALGGSRKLSSMSEAVTRLGGALIKNLAICVALKDRFSSRNSTFSSLLDHEIHQSLHRSITGFILAKALLKSSPDTLLLAGLVSHIGHIVILRFINDEPDFKNISCDQANELLNDYGGTVTQLILSQWDFSNEIFTAIFSDEEVNLITPATMHDIYTLANQYTANILPTDIKTRVQNILAENKTEIDAMTSIFK